MPYRTMVLRKVPNSQRGCVRPSQASRRLGRKGVDDAVILVVAKDDRRVLAQGLYEALTVDLRPRLSQITAPVTVVYGWTRDPDAPRNRLEGLYRYGFQGLARPVRFERIEGAEHQVMIEQPQRFLAAVQRFLS